MQNLEFLKLMRCRDLSHTCPEVCSNLRYGMLQGSQGKTSRELLNAHTLLVERLACQLEDKHSKEKNEACLGVKRTCEAETEVALKRLRCACEQEALEVRQQLEAALAESKQMSALQEANSKQLTYIVRGCKSSSGSVPRQIFEAEVGSLLNRMYNGEWEYAKDATGQALVNSEPAHWGIILNWLSFGTVPCQPTHEFISECKYWQLNRLLKEIELQQNPGPAQTARFSSEKSHDFEVRALEQGECMGFAVEGHIFRFAERFRQDTAIEIHFAAYGAKWKLWFGIGGNKTSRGAWLHLQEGPDNIGNVSFNIGPQQHSKAVKLTNTGRNTFKAKDTGFGGAFSAKQVLQVQWYPCVDMQGSAQFLMEFTPMA